jgi:hypothetical protein
VGLLRGTDWVFNPFNLAFKLLSSYGKVAKFSGRKCQLQFTFPFDDNIGRGDLG